MSGLNRRALVIQAAPAAALAGLFVAAGGSSAAAAEPPGGLVLVEPFRIQDSRVNEPTKYDTGATDGLAVPGLSSYRAVLLNVTVTETEGTGYLRLGSTAVDPPPTSNVNWWGAGQTLANLAVVFTGLGAGGITLQVRGAGRTHVILDVMGFVA